jgi:hypothetical protein
MSEYTTKPIEVTAVLSPDGDEALYVFGEKVFSDSCVRVGDVVAIFGGEPIILTQAILADDFTDQFEDWPEKYEDLIPYIEAD